MLLGVAPLDRGASGHPRLEPNFYLLNGEPKRFFDREALESLFLDGWRTLHLESCVIHRYARPKAIWEAVYERVPLSLEAASSV